MSSRRVLVLAVAGVAAFAAACADPSGTSPRATSDGAFPDSAEQMLSQVIVHLSHDGVSKGRLLADTLFTYEGGERLELGRFNGVLFDSVGAENVTITAREGTYNTRLSRLEARGDVVVLREDGTQLETPQLVYDQLRNQIFSDTSFVFNDPPNKQLTGIGFETDPQLNQFRTVRNSKGVVPVKVETP